MKTIRKEKIETVLRELREAHQSATMETASFDSPDIDGTREEISAIIRKATALYRDSWILSPLERSIKILEDELARKFGRTA